MLVALLLSRALRLAVRGVMAREPHLDRTTMTFLQQIGIVAIWIVMLILYAHLIPVLRSLGTALLTGASIASVVIGLAAQSTLGNLVAGVAITLYRPFRLGDRLQVAAPTGTEVGNVESLSLGYTTLRTDDGRFVVVPNSIAASQVAINLSASQAHTPAPLTITIRIGRAADIEAARQVALETAGATGTAFCRAQSRSGGWHARELLVGSAIAAGCAATHVDSAVIATLDSGHGCRATNRRFSPHGGWDARGLPVTR